MVQKTTRRWSKKSQLALVLLFGLILLMLWMQGVFHHRVGPESAARQAGKQPGSLYTVGFREVMDWQEAPGLVASFDQPKVAAQIMARVIKVHVAPGERVQAGQVLAVLDEAEVQSRVGQARGHLSSVQAQLASAAADYRRFTGLLARKVVPQRDFDVVEARYLSFKGQVEQAAQAVREAEANQRYALVKAPFAGVVAEKLVDPGDLATPGQSLFTLYDPLHMRIEAQVGEQFGPQLRVGQAARVAIPSLDLDIDAVLEEVVAQAASRSRTFLIKARLPENPELRPGMFGRLSFAGISRQALVVPATAVENLGQLESIKVVTGQEVARRQIKTGKRYGEFIEILSGLTPGDQILLPATSPPAG